MESTQTKSKFGVTGRIERKTHEVEGLTSKHDDWEQMSKEEKLAASREVEPSDSETVYNVTTNSLHEYFVDNLDPNQNSTEDNVEIDFIGLGTDAASGTSETDTDLNNRVFEETVTDITDNGEELLTSTFVDSTEANGGGSQPIDEVGLFTGDPGNLSNTEVFLVNHATFSTVTKDNSKTVTFDVTLQFNDG